jgi:hypothetical protein
MSCIPPDFQKNKKLEMKSLQPGFVPHEPKDKLIGR